MQEFNWIQKYKEKIGSAASAIKLIKSGNNIFIGTGCGQPQHLVDALVKRWELHLTPMRNSAKNSR